jgi:hypothetical protein
MVNRHRSWVFAVLVFACELVACGPRVTTIRMGAVYAPKPDGCGVRWENLNHQEALSKYEMIGLITITNMRSSALTEDVRHDVDREACTLGADAVTLNAGVNTNLQFVAWHSKH